MKHLMRMAFLFLAVFLCLTAAYAEHSDTDIAYPVTGGNIYFDKDTGTITDCDESVTGVITPAKIEGVSITAIGDGAFFQCTSLTNIEIPDSVTTIGAGAFSKCASLTSIEIPDSVMTIGGDAFSDCTSLTNANISDGVAVIESRTFFGCSNMKNIEIPDSVTTIGYCAFASCGLTSVIIPNSVTLMSSYAFNVCRDLKSVQISNSITFIGTATFYGCSSLSSVEIPDGVTSLESASFENCANLASIFIPKSVKSIQSLAFAGCDNLRVYYSGSEDEWNKIRGIYVLANHTIYFNNSRPQISEIQVTTSEPTVNGRAISAADLNGLKEITIPLAVSVDTPSEITAFVPFYDADGRFIGVGSVTQTVDRDTASVTVPVTDDVSEAASVKVMICGALCPASPSNSYPIA